MKLESIARSFPSIPQQQRLLLDSQKVSFLSGSPASVYQDQAPRPAEDLTAAGSPILGICYGLQVLAFDMGGEVKPSPSREFGYARLKVTEQSSPLFRGLPDEMDVWMSHGDHVTAVPDGFAVTAVTDDALNAMEDLRRGIFGVQFHPEVAHTPLGAQVLRNFLFNVCGCRGDWSPAAVIEDQVASHTLGSWRRRAGGLRSFWRCGFHCGVGPGATRLGPTPDLHLCR